MNVALLAGVTSFVGGTGSDTVTTPNGSLSGAATINGGGGTDTLKVASQITTSVEGAKYTSFDVLNVGVGAQQDVSLISGISSEILSVSGAGLSNLTAAQAAAITVSATNASSTISLASANDTASDVLSLTLKNSTVATEVDFTNATVNGFETLNVAVAGGVATAIASDAAAGADHISFTAATNLKSLVVTGGYDVGINLASNATALTTLDVSGTAGAGIILGSNASTLTVTGSANTDFVTVGAGLVNVNLGAGNDTVTGTAAQIANDTLNGGGGTDTLSLNLVGTLSDSTFAHVSSFDALTVTDTSANIVSGGFFNNAFAGGATVTATSLTSASTFDFSTYNAALTETITASAGSVVVKGGTAANTISLSGSATGVTSSITGGSADDSITGGSGNDIITGGAGADTINGGSGADTITGGAGADVLTGGAGADTFVVTAQTTAAGIDYITDFVGGGSDVLRTGITPLNAVLTDLTSTVFAGTTLAAQASLAVAAAQAALAGNYASAGDAVLFKFGTDTYVTVNDGANTTFTDGTDVLVKLTGLTGTMVIGDIVA